LGVRAVARNTQRRRYEGIKVVDISGGGFGHGAVSSSGNERRSASKPKNYMKNNLLCDFVVHVKTISSTYAPRGSVSRGACTKKLIMSGQCRREAPQRRRFPSGAVGYPFLRHSRST
jgi:hypothetical protein